MNNQKFISDIKQGFMLKRIRAQEECEEFINGLRKTEEFDNLYSNYLKKQLEYFKSNYEQESVALKNEVELLKQKIEQYLTNNNIDKNKLQPKYDCAVCDDTGIANGKMCECLKKEINYKKSVIASSKIGFTSFENSNESIMNETDIKAQEWLKNWCSKYPEITKININIMGAVGTGKTFMLECVANELINKNAVVCYKTAFELNELARLYHIGKSFDFSDCVNADILLIDDLGTEPILKNVTKEYLYNLINVRQSKNKPTFISTNLSLENILDRYDERIFSRLANKNLSVNILLNSTDKRLK